MNRSIASALIAALISAGALAQGVPPAIPRPTTPAIGGDAAAKLSFEALDKDRDGKLTPDEARANTTVAANFAAADKNNDGSLSRAEFETYFNKDKN